MGDGIWEVEVSGMTRGIDQVRGVREVGLL